MSAQPDGVNDLLTRDLQAAMAVAGRWGEMMARRRAEQAQDLHHAQQQRRRELEERFEAQRAMTRTELAPVGQDRFWEDAKPEEIAERYGLARQWEGHDQVARAARERIEVEVKNRHGLGVEDYLRDHGTGKPVPVQDGTLGMREAVNAQRDQVEAARLVERSALGDLQNDQDARNAAAEVEELWDSGDRRARLAARLSSLIGSSAEGREAAEAILLTDQDQGTPPTDAVRSSKRAPRARKHLARGAGRERPLGLG
ncbi:hypothetical protein RF644_18090 [Kocuria sp. CPCC 205258]|uniref:hypothetical protein n=1 Tax=Kocuria sp. CPCC 205258 TaxID=3073552 RepID=UPI0034D7993B